MTPCILNEQLVLGASISGEAGRCSKLIIFATFRCKSESNTLLIQTSDDRLTWFDCDATFGCDEQIQIEVDITDPYFRIVGNGASAVVSVFKDCCRDEPTNPFPVIEAESVALTRRAQRSRQPAFGSTET